MHSKKVILTVGGLVIAAVVIGLVIYFLKKKNDASKIANAISSSAAPRAVGQGDPFEDEELDLSGRILTASAGKCSYERARTKAEAILNQAIYERGYEEGMRFVQENASSLASKAAEEC